jgi:hypothetical protein
VALGTAPALVRLIDRTGRERLGPCDLGWPPRARPGWAPAGDAVRVLALDEPGRTAGGGVDLGLGWGPVLLHPRPRERRRTRRLRHGGGGRVNRRHQGRGRGLARGTDRHQIAGPQRITRVAIARLGRLGRGEALGRPWDLTVRLAPYTRSGALPRR